MLNDPGKVQITHTEPSAHLFQLAPSTRFGSLHPQLNQPRLTHPALSDIILPKATQDHRKVTTNCNRLNKPVRLSDL